MCDARNLKFNADSIYPFIISRVEEAGRDRAWKVIGPNTDGVYPWPDYDSAYAEAKRLKDELVKYHYMLISFDWYFEYGSHESYLRGREQKKAIDALQKKVDPDLSIFNHYAPEALRRKACA